MSDPINLKSILYETIHQNIPEVPLPASYEEHLDCMVKTFHFCHDRYLRSLHGELYLTGWHTGKDSIQRVFHTTLSSPILRAWNTPFKNGMRGVFHAHTNTEFIYAADGISYFFVNGEKVSLFPGEILLINPGVPHAEFLYSEESAVFSLGVNTDFPDSHDFTYAVLSPLADASDMSVFFRLLLLELYGRCPGKALPDSVSPKRVRHILEKDFHIRQMRHEISPYRALTCSIYSYVLTHYPTTSAADIAGHFHYNADYLNRIFRKENAVTLASFIQNIRLGEAFRMINETQLPIGQIIHYVGYQNQGYFYRIFTHRYGISPGELRKKAQSISS